MGPYLIKLSSGVKEETETPSVSLELCPGSHT